MRHALCQGVLEDTQNKPALGFGGVGGNRLPELATQKLKQHMTSYTYNALAAFSFLLFFIFYYFLSLGIEPRALPVLRPYLTTVQHSLSPFQVSCRTISFLNKNPVQFRYFGLLFLHLYTIKRIGPLFTCVAVLVTEQIITSSPSS